MKALTALYALCIVLIAGCKKDAPADQATHNNNLTARINTWLNSPQHTGTIERSKKVNRCRNISITTVLILKI